MKTIKLIFVHVLTMQIVNLSLDADINAGQVRNAIAASCHNLRQCERPAAKLEQKLHANCAPTATQRRRSDVSDSANRLCHSHETLPLLLAISRAPHACALSQPTAAQSTSVQTVTGFLIICCCCYCCCCLLTRHIRRR